MSEIELRKLSLAKYIFLHGCSHANNRDRISRMLAIHHFDFAIEMILKTIALKHNIVLSSKKDPRFKEMWNQIQNQDIKLPLKNEMFALHDERNQVQHSGTIPSLETVIRFKEATRVFLEKVTREVFDISFDELSLSQLIENTELRKLIQNAEKLLAEEKYEDCIKICDEALIKATFEIGDIFRKAGILTRYFGAGDELVKIINENYAERYKSKDFYILAKDISRAILQLGQAATGMQFLDEYRVRFIEFRELIGNLQNIPRSELKEKAQLALNFVIELILKWQEEGVIRSSKEEEK